MHDKYESNIECGPDRLLYDRRVREFMASQPVADQRAGEALAALRAASHAFRLRMDRWLEHHGLSESRMAVLIRLSRMGEMTQGELASLLDMSARNITGLVDHLERDGLVVRHTDPEDRRAVRVRVSPLGKERLDQLSLETNRGLDDLVTGFSGEELEQLRHLLLKLAQNMNAPTAKELETV